MITAEVTISGEVFSADIEKAIIQAVDETIALAHKDFKDTIKTFSARSQFDFEVKRAVRRGDTIEGGVGTDNLNYTRLNNGVPAHQVGKGGKYMSFRPVYTPKTSRGVISSRSGGTSGRRQRAKGPWTHPGFPARQFDMAIRNKRIKDLGDKVNKAIALSTK